MLIVVFLGVASTSPRHNQAQREAKDTLRPFKAYLLGMDALLLTILGAVGLVGLGVFISSEIQRKQGKTDAQISSRDNNQGFVIVVVVIFVIYFVALMIKGE